MRIRILRERLDVLPDLGPPLPLSRGQVRQLLCVLAVESNRVVSVPRLLDMLWEDTAGPDPTKSLKQAVYNARKHLPSGRLLTEIGGYRLRLDPVDHLDLTEFRDLINQARAVRDDRPEAAASFYEQALDLWGDPPLGDLPDVSAMEPIRQGLLGERQDAREELAEVRLLLGRYRELIAPVTTWLAADPFNEHLRGLLMLALNGSARKGAALQIYREAVELLAPSARPGMWLQELARKIARDDPQVAWQPRPVWSALATKQVPDVHIDTGIPNVARMYDYYLGGKDNYAADREAAERVIDIWPTSRADTRANRAFIGRAVRFLAEEAGIDQFLDIGCGLPTQRNVHEIAQSSRPDARVVYVDSDPVVLVHARALLASDRNVRVIGADARDPDSILCDPAFTQLIDLRRPVAVLLFGVLHCIPNQDQVQDILGRLRDALVPGSYVAISHITRPIETPDRLQAADKGAQVYTKLNANMSMTFRSREQLSDLFLGMDLCEPGLVDVSEWRPDPNSTELAAPTTVWLGGVARKVRS
jgi:DNA-binding SARP family transcriptional activator